MKNTITVIYQSSAFVYWNATYSADMLPEILLSNPVEIIDDRTGETIYSK